jgi:IS5 family transposase
LIVKYLATYSEVHDSRATDILLDGNGKGEPFYADSAYRGEPQEQIIAGKEMENRVCEKRVPQSPADSGTKNQ